MTGTRTSTKISMSIGIGARTVVRARIDEGGEKIESGNLRSGNRGR